MIKVNELRVGNWVEADRAYLKVLSVVQKGLDVEVHWKSESISTSGITFAGYSDVKPIPLTPEILEKCGFSDNKGYLTLKMRFNEIYLTKSGQIALVDKDVQFTPVYAPTYIKYLHQLQNLYFALTGEELSVKL